MLSTTSRTQTRLSSLRQFYNLLDGLEQRMGGKRRLRDCNGRVGWPKRGVYFFFQESELRSDSGDGLRVVRIGTHALKRGSRTSLWHRLAQHRGIAKSGGGNHRGSIFRLLVGTALIQREPTFVSESWGKGNTAPREVRLGEHDLECQVSNVIGQMPFLWLSIPDKAGPDSLRNVVERNAIALLSNYDRQTLDPPSNTRLFSCSCAAIWPLEQQPCWRSS